MGEKTTKTKFWPRARIWVVYVDGKPSVWCLSKASAEKYRKWGKRKVKQSIRIREYRIVEGWERTKERIACGEFRDDLNQTGKK